jgi:methylenetetrahydrofolate reductase (NADPH)
LVARIKREFGIEPAAHLTCVGATRDELKEVIDRLGTAGIRNIFAIRGDPPRGEAQFSVTEGGLSHANELIAFIRECGDFCIGAACYPEVHPEAIDADTDLGYVKAKVDAGADYLITQLFFDNTRFFAFRDRLREAGIDVPLLAGIMPVTNVSQIERFASMCGAIIPTPLHAALREADGDPHEVFWTGVSYAARQCDQLLAPQARDPYAARPRGAAGIHFYTLNKTPAARAIFEILKLARGD